MGYSVEIYGTPVFGVEFDIDEKIGCSDEFLDALSEDFVTQLLASSQLPEEFKEIWKGVLQDREENIGEVSAEFIKEALLGNWQTLEGDGDYEDYVENLGISMYSSVVDQMGEARDISTILGASIDEMGEDETRLQFESRIKALLYFTRGITEEPSWCVAATYWVG